MAGDFLFDTNIFNDLGHSGLDAAFGNGARCSISMFAAMLTVGEYEIFVAMDGPKPAEGREGCVRQRYQSIFVALGITDDYLLVSGIDIADFKIYPFAKPETHGINGKKNTL